MSDDSLNARESAEPTLLRTMGVWQMAAYGAGSMLGAGIYGLIFLLPLYFLEARTGVIIM